MDMPICIPFPSFVASVGTRGEELLEKTTSAADVIGGDTDLLAEILLLLPVKSLLRFKSVSKRWLSLISSPHFSRRHARRNPYAVSGIFLRRTPGLEGDAEFEFVSLRGKLSAAPFTSLKFADDPQGIKILQSCNGLLFCCSSRRVDNKRSYYIYNPTTKQFVTLPRPIDDACTTILGICLAFDPLKSPHYKVVCVSSTVSSLYHYQILIYSSEDAVWKVSGDPFTAPYDMVFHNGVFSNGAIHWISPRGASLYFDIEGERLGTMPTHPFTEQWGKRRRFRYFGECCGHLHLLEISGSQTTRFEVFEMQRDYSRWVLKYHVDLDAIISAYPEMVQPYLDPPDFYYAFSILSIVREVNDEESSLLLHIPGKIVSYKFKDKTFKILQDLAPGYPKTGALQFGCFDVNQYIETLASVC